jgi:sulfate transport system permease protein
MEAHPAARDAISDRHPRSGALYAPTGFKRRTGTGVGLGRGLVSLYLSLIVMLPLAAVLEESLSGGLGAFWDSVTGSESIAALKLTVICSLIVVAINAVFGTIVAWVLVRDEFPGKGAVNALIDGIINLPFAISPVVIGLSLFLLYGNEGWFGPALAEWGIRVLFSTPGMILASVFVSLPFVVRETVPVLREIGTEQEQAASTLGAGAWQTFWRVTLPAIRWGVAYGVVLTTARVLGEFGAVTIVSGSISGETETLPLFVAKAFEQFDEQAAYAGAMDVAEQLVVINEGRVEQSGTAGDLYDHPANEFVMSFFVGEVNRLGRSSRRYTDGWRPRTA